MNEPQLRIVFAGTPEFAAAHLDALLESNANHKVVGVFSQPDRPKGRGKHLVPTPVKQLALENDIPVFQPLSLKDESAKDLLKSLNPDVMIVVAYGLLLPEQILSIPRYGCLNVHASLLPRWRGAAPIERAILAGDEETGTCIMQMDAGLDTGVILLSKKTQIRGSDSAASVTDRLVKLGQTSLLEALSLLGKGELTPTLQDESKSTYAKKIDKRESRINWSDSAGHIQRQVMAFFPRSPAYTEMGQERIRIIKSHIVTEPTDINVPPGTIISASGKGLIIQCGEKTLSISELQLPGKKPVSIKDLLNGQKDRFIPGSVFNC